MQTAVTSKHARFPRKIVDQSKDLFCEMSPQWSDPHFMGVFKVIIKYKNVSVYLAYRVVQHPSANPLIFGNILKMKREV